MDVLIKRNVKEEDWREFLRLHDNARIYHTPEWKKFLEKTFNYIGYYLFAIDSSDNILGMLPLFYITSKIFGKRLCCLPFAHECGPIGDDKVVRLLLSEALSLSESLNCNVEIRDYVGNFLHSDNYYTYILKLSSNLEEVWRNFDKGSVRWAIKKSEKYGIKVEKSLDYLDEFYELNSITKKKLGVPCHPLRFFKNLRKYLWEYISLYVSKYNNDIIAGGIMIYYRDTVLYGYGASNPNYLNFYPNNALLWSAIKEACMDDYKYFDFGRVFLSNTGLMRFKKRWGTSEKKLSYSYYPNVKTINENSPIYGFGKKVIKRMPLVLYKKLSEIVFGWFG